jgi:hypothetical protein
MTSEEIRECLPQIDNDDQLLVVSEKDLPNEGIVEIFIVGVKNIGLRVYRSLKIQKLVYVVLITLSVLEGLNTRIPLEEELPNIVIELENPKQWIETILANRNSYTKSQYFQFTYPANPSPEEATYIPDKTTIVAPITASQYFPKYRV